MADYFNIFGLPSVVQDLITEEIVHNSNPDNRLQFALTCKTFNDLVKCAKPKKMIRSLMFSCCKDKINYGINSTRFDCKNLSKLENILQNSQFKILSIKKTGLFFDKNCSQHSKFLDLLFEACKFVEQLCISECKSEFVQFYQKLENLKCLNICGKPSEILILPFLPTKILVDNDFISSADEFVAEKIVQSSVKLIRIDGGNVKLDDVQQFLKIAKFQVDVQIHVYTYNPYRKIIMTCVDDDTYVVERLFNYPQLFVNQDFNNPSKRILKLKKSPPFFTTIFAVKSAKNPQNVFSYVHFTNEKKSWVVENVNETDVFKVDAVSNRRFYAVHYSKNLLETWFPPNKFGTTTERFKAMNNMLGTNFDIVTSGNLTEKLISKSSCS